MKINPDQLGLFGNTMAQPKQMNDKTNKVKPDEVISHGDGTFEVKSQSTPGVSYTVDLNERTCTCPAFQNRKVECKHITMVTTGKKPEKREWQDLTKNGYPRDQVVSALQKEIRRGNEEMAVWWARELVESGMWNYLFKRLMVICGEDIGHANPGAMMLVTSTYSALVAQEGKAAKKFPPDNNIYQFVVGYMARSKKSRHVDYLGGIIYKNAESGWHPEIPDYAKDQHTKQGRAMGRGDDEFFREGARIKNKAHVEGEDEIKKKCLEMYGFTEGRDENEF